MGLVDVTLVGHDVGGMVTFAYLHRHRDLARAVIANPVVPGIAAGLRAAGIEHLTTAEATDAGHCSPEKTPREVWAGIRTSARDYSEARRRKMVTEPPSASTRVYAHGIPAARAARVTSSFTSTRLPSVAGVHDTSGDQSPAPAKVSAT
jgi:pimeloyl-ACP methyl ester carboxylesterase